MTPEIMDDAPDRPHPPAPALFWVAVGAFLLSDAANLAVPQLAANLDADLVHKVLAYLLLGAFAIAFAYVAATGVLWARTRRAPARGDLVRASVALLLIAAHAGLIVLAASRRGG